MRRLAVALAVSAAGASLAGQAPVFRSSVELVRFDVSVTKGDQPVRNLTAADFEVVDNGRPQAIADVTIDRSPLSVLMVLDTSGSMAGGKLRLLVSATQALTASLRPADRVAIVGFSHEISVKVRLTADRSLVAAALDSLRPYGATALRDALYAALDLAPSDDSRPVVLLFSDGEDTSSWLTEDDAVDAVRRAGVTIQPIDIHNDRRDESIQRAAAYAARFLDHIADASGGRRWSGNSARDLRELFSRALDEMRSRYVVSFYPTNASPGWHAVSVKVKGTRADVRTRPGYFVPAPVSK